MKMIIENVREAIEEYDNLQGEIDDFESEQTDLDTTAGDYDEDHENLQVEIDAKEEEQCQVNDSLKATECVDIDDGRSWVEAADASSYDDEVFEAAFGLSIDASQVEEAYHGFYSSDAKFAEEYAEQLGAVDSEVSWPYTCIDWDWASRDLMMDYGEEDGHYFRNL